METLRQQGELYLIGAEISMLESRDRRALETSGGSLSSFSTSGHGCGSTGGAGVIARPSTTYRRLPQPQGEMHLQVGLRKVVLHCLPGMPVLLALGKGSVRWSCLREGAPPSGLGGAGKAVSSCCCSCAAHLGGGTEAAAGLHPL